MNEIIRKAGKVLWRVFVTILAVLLILIAVLWHLVDSLIGRLHGALSFLIFGRAPLPNATIAVKFVLKNGHVSIACNANGNASGHPQFKADILRAADLYSDVNDLVFGDKLNPRLHLAVVKAAAKQKASELDCFQHVLADLFGSGDAQIVTDVNDLPADVREALGKMFGGR